MQWDGWVDLEEGDGVVGRMHGWIAPVTTHGAHGRRSVLLYTSLQLPLQSPPCPFNFHPAPSLKPSISIQGLNGQSGYVRKYDALKGRVGVELPPPHGLVSLRPVNLLVDPEARRAELMRVHRNERRTRF